MATTSGNHRRLIAPSSYAYLLFAYHRESDSYLSPSQLSWRRRKVPAGLTFARLGEIEGRTNERFMSNERRRQSGFKGLASLDEVLQREGLREEVTVRAFKRLLALKLVEEMEAQNLSKTVMAQRMGTSRAQLDRVLDPDTYNVTIETIARAAQTLGKRLTLDLA